MNQESKFSDQNDGKRNNDCPKNDSAFECNICLDTARDAVVSMCGHLFCWPCLYQWLYTTDRNSLNHKTCPVCKSAISREKTIPIYGRGGDETNRQDPRDKLPPRPSGQRTEVPTQPNHQFHYPNARAFYPGVPMFGFGNGGFHMSFGIGSLPQYLFAIAQELTGNETTNDTDFFMARFFAVCGFLFIVLFFYFG